MRPFKPVSGLATPLDRANVDTDQIIPKQFLKSIARTGFGKHLFFGWRYDSKGAPVPDFVLNDPAYSGSPVLVAGENFGCGSSREHAAWAISDYGYAVVIAPSFADIFYNNCIKNGILPVTLKTELVSEILKASRARIDVDLKSQTVKVDADGTKFDSEFSINAHSKRMLLYGLDDIALTLEHAEHISKYEKTHTVLPIGHAI